MQHHYAYEMDELSEVQLREMGDRTKITDKSECAVEQENYVNFYRFQLDFQE